MPELPDLLYIRRHLEDGLLGRAVTGVVIRQPVVLRNALGIPPGDVLRGAAVTQVAVRGPFLTLSFSGGHDLVMNLMLAGRLQLRAGRDKPLGHLCLALSFTDRELRLVDEQLMAKVYLIRHDQPSAVPAYTSQGIDILSAAFTLETFRTILERHGRRQIRALLNDHTALSAIGNAYADEILFEAGIHPKTFTARLSEVEVRRLYEAIRTVIAWGIAEVEKAAAPIQEKVRGHMRVRNRKGEPCLRCGTKIRREGVRGYDVYFCPRCQPASRRLFLDWGSGAPGSTPPGPPVR